MFEYVEKIKEQIDRVSACEEDSIKAMAKEFGRCIIEDRLIHVIGTGHSHMIGLELFIRAGGLANVNCMLDSVLTTADGAVRSSNLEKLEGLAEVIWNEHKISNDDFILVISNGGRNALPIEMAMIARNKGLKVGVITSLEQSKRYDSRHSSGRKLYELGDIVIDNHVPSGDGLMMIGDELVGAASSMSGFLLVNTIVTEAIKIAVDAGVKLPIYGSQNIDESDNGSLYDRYRGRIKHM